MLTQAQVRNLFAYDPATGILYRRNKPKVKPITSPTVRHGGEFYMTSRIIYAYMIDDNIPANIMRIDKNVRNNKWVNFTWTTETRKSMQTRKMPSFRLTPEFVHKIFTYDAETDTLRTKHPTNPVTVTTSKVNLGGNYYHRSRIIFILQTT
jgi:hypothetical protein